MAETVVLKALADRVLVRIPGPYPGRLGQLVAYLREQLPGVAVDWTAVREAYAFGRDRFFPVASRHPEDALAEKAKVRFGPDGLTAYLVLYPPKPRGRRLDPEELQDLVLSYGVAAELLDAGALRRAHQRKTYHEPEVVARGRPPVDGHPAWVRWPRGLPSDREGFLTAFGELEDYPDTVLATVSAGETAGEYHRAGLGTPGISARGAAILARRGGDPIELGPGLRRDQGSTAVVAEAEGHLRLSGVGGIRAEVVPLLRTSDPQELRRCAEPVFPGSVVVEGDLEIGFPLRILGDLEVRGSLIRSPVEVMGSLFVRDGIIRRGGAPVRVGGLAVAAFLDHGTLLAHTVLVRRYSLKSEILALDALLTTKEGSIQGGSAAAGREVRAGAVGSTNAMGTEIAVGTASLSDPFRALYSGWAAALAEAPGEGSSPPAAMLAAASQWKAAADRLNSPDPGAARLRAQTAHPGVSVRMGTATRTVENAVGPAEFVFERVGPRGRVALNRL